MKPFWLLTFQHFPAFRPLSPKCFRLFSALTAWHVHPGCRLTANKRIPGGLFKACQAYISFVPLIDPLVLFDEFPMAMPVSSTHWHQRGPSTCSCSMPYITFPVSFPPVLRIGSFSARSRHTISGFLSHAHCDFRSTCWRVRSVRFYRTCSRLRPLQFSSSFPPFVSFTHSFYTLYTAASFPVIYSLLGTDEKHPSLNARVYFILLLDEELEPLFVSIFVRYIFN